VPSTSETLYAHWTIETYTFYFIDNKQGNTEKSGEYGSEIILPARNSIQEIGSSITLSHTLDNPSFKNDESRSTSMTPKTTTPFSGWLYNNTLYEGGSSQTVDGDRIYNASYGNPSTIYDYSKLQLPPYSNVDVSTTITTTLDYNYGNFSDIKQSKKTITYTHSKWTSGGKNYSTNATVWPTSNTTYTSVWTDTISYGTITLPEPSREGYNFLGWFTEQGEIVSNNYVPTADIALYAHWEVAQFITTVTRYISDSFSSGEKCEVYYYDDENKKWIPIEEIKYYNGSSWVQVGEQIPYIED
jgi:uncharacterized repeat protein (TIGR02543 family)